MWQLCSKILVQLLALKDQCPPQKLRTLPTYKRPRSNFHLFSNAALLAIRLRTVDDIALCFTSMAHGGVDSLMGQILVSWGTPKIAGKWMLSIISYGTSSWVLTHPHMRLPWFLRNHCDTIVACCVIPQTLWPPFGMSLASVSSP